MSEHILNRNDKSEHITQLDNVVRIIIVWSEWGDSNSRHLAPKASALPTALHPVIKFSNCGQTCGQRRFLTSCRRRLRCCQPRCPKAFRVFRGLRPEPRASCSQITCATNCATPGYSIFLHDTMQRRKKQVFRVCGRRCGQARFCGNFSTGEFSPQATVPRTSGISLSGEWIGRLSSQIKRNTTFTISRYSMFHFTFDTYQQTGILFAHRLTIS